MALDSLGGFGTRFFPSGQGADEETESLRQDIADLVSSCENLSKTICENCGDPGVLRPDLPWKKTLCQACYRRP